MEEVRVKILSIREKLSTVQRDILDIMNKNDTTDYNDSRIRSRYGQAVVLEFILDKWIERYRQDSQMFWSGHDLNEESY